WTGCGVGAELFPVAPFRSRIHRHSGAPFRLSLVALRETVVLLSLPCAMRSDSKLTATSCSPIPRKPPTPITTAATFPSLARIISLILPIDSFASFTTVEPISLLARISLPCWVYHCGCAPDVGLTARGLGWEPGIPRCCANAIGDAQSATDTAVAAITHFIRILFIDILR